LYRCSCSGFLPSICKDPHEEDKTPIYFIKCNREKRR
jgi:hypothetical protein